jgi:hypothetical protein
VLAKLASSGVSGFDDPFLILRRVHEELQILDGVDGAGAAALRRELFARPLDSLTAADLTRVQERVAAARPAPARPRASYIERDYGAYLDAIPHGRTLLGDIEELARSGDFAEFTRRSERVFVERLGFGAGRVDETSRLRRSEIARAEKIGSFHEFEVVCVELTRPNWYADFYSVVFRLHPYALVLSLEPHARALRFVFRRGPSARPEYRSLTGPHTDWEPNDNLLVWAWRLHQLRPRLGESLHMLHRRVTEALSRSPEEIGADWPSIRFPADQSPPGVPWASAARRAFESFLQLDTPASERRRWGLEAVLQDRFPIELGDADALVEYVGYEVAQAPAEEAEAMIQERECEVLLHLAVRHGEVREPVDVRCCLPEPDDAGRFWLDGVCQRFSAVVCAGGRLAAFLSDVVLTDEDDDDDDEEEAVAVEDISEDAESPTTEDVRDEGRRGGQRGFRGLSPRAFLEYAVSRRLAGAAYGLRRAQRAPDVPLREHVHAALLRAGRRIDRLPLAAWGALRAFLRPDHGASTLTAEDWQVAAVPPSWCCLDRSAGLPVGSFIPIAGARMHPTGLLAVPRLEGSNARLVLSEESALAVHGRSAGPATAETRAWWISDDLARFAGLPVGQLERSEQAVHARAVAARVVLRHGPERRAWVLRSLSLPRRAPQVLTIRVPARRAGAPELLVGVGAGVGAGAVWLRLAARTWSMSRWQSAGIERLADEVAAISEVRGEPFADDPRLVVRVPAGIAGIVTQASVTPVRRTLGTVAGWVARVVIEPAADARGVVITNDGAAYTIAGTLDREDVPFGDDGEVAEMVLEGPHVSADDGEVVVDPTTEAYVQGKIASTVVYVAPSLVAIGTPPERHGQIRWLDGEGIPGHALAPAFTEHERLRWLILEPAAARFVFELDSVLPVPTWIGPFSDAAWAAGFALDPALAPKPAPAVVPGEFFDPIVTKIHKRPAEPPPGAVRGLARPVLHPWHKPAAGALLGVTVAELELLVRRHGLEPVIEALGVAARAPEEAALQRLALVSSREVQQALGDGLVALRRLGASPAVSTLVLTGLPVPPGRLIPVGIPAGSSRPLFTPLLTRYRQVELADQLCRVLAYSVAEIRVAAEVELQATVDALFGEPTDAAPRGTTLAGWLARAWPLTRVPALRTNCDDLTWGTDADGRPVPAVLDDGAPVGPPARVEVRVPADPGWWLERSARAWLLEQRVAWFLGLFAGLDTEDGPRPGVTLDAPVGSRGAWAAREWVRRLELPESRPSQLVRLLTRSLPLRLASDGAEARAALAPVLLAALPGLDADGQLLRELLAEILGGFWSLTVGAECPGGWAWLPADAAPVRGSRYLPPLKHRAWLQWPWTTRAGSAPQLVTALASGQRLPPLLQVVCGHPDAPELPVPAPMELVAPGSANGATTDAAVQPVLEPVPVVVGLAPAVVMTPASIQDDIVVVKTGLRVWLAQTRREVSP